MTACSRSDAFRSEAVATASSVSLAEWASTPRCLREVMSSSGVIFKTGARSVRRACVISAMARKAGLPRRPPPPRPEAAKGIATASDRTSFAAAMTESDFSGSCTVGYDSVFPTRTCGIPPQAKPETSRFPYKELPHMPGSSTTPGWAAARTNAPVHVAFRDSDHVGARYFQAFAAQWLAYALPYRRFDTALADCVARLRADAVCYSFIVADFHHLLLAGFAGAPKFLIFAHRPLCRRTPRSRAGLLAEWPEGCAWLAPWVFRTRCPWIGTKRRGRACP